MGLLVSKKANPICHYLSVLMLFTAVLGYLSTSAEVYDPTKSAPLSRSFSADDDDNDDEGEEEITYEPTEEHLLFNIHGFRLYVSNLAMTTRPEATEAAIWALRSQITYIANVFPHDAVVKMRETKIWLNDETHGLTGEDWDNEPCRWACFQLDHMWAEDNPDTAYSVLFRNVDKLVQWTQCCGSILIHELGHAYHYFHIDDGYDNQKIIDAYHRAVDSGAYDEVRGIFSGMGTRRSYAMTNHKEYFAVLLATSWNYHQTYPFVRSDLDSVDIGGAWIVWDAMWRPSVLAPDNPITQTTGIQTYRIVSQNEGTDSLKQSSFPMPLEH